mmetsp:Transcript_28287/g.50454  ORF Transcript_28287/g.50454 Transcript_28287/m.50454 type:complete len:216 (-) Transcript_28287:17-664(-)
MKCRFGFLYNGYKRSHFYWEFLIIYRKLLIILIWAFQNFMSVQVQALSINLVLCLFLCFHYISQPFMNDTLNRLEFLACFTAGVTIYCGLYYLTMALSEGVKVFLFCVMLMSNACFYWLMFKHLFAYYLHKGAAFIPYLKMIIKQDYFPDAHLSNKPLMKLAYQPANSKELSYCITSIDSLSLPDAYDHTDPAEFKQYSHEMTLPSAESFTSDSF